MILSMFGGLKKWSEIEKDWHALRKYLLEIIEESINVDNAAIKLSEQEYKELNRLIQEIPKSNRHLNDELIAFAKTLKELHQFWESEIPQLQRLKEFLSNEDRPINRHKYMETFDWVNKARKLFKKIYKHIIDEESHKINPWHLTVGEASLEDMSYNGDKEAEQALGYIDDINMYSKKLHRCIDLTMEFLNKLNKYLS